MNKYLGLTRALQQGGDCKQSNDDNITGGL